jgi:hypothetical protein
MRFLDVKTDYAEMGLRAMVSRSLVAELCASTC